MYFKYNTNVFSLKVLNLTTSQVIYQFLNKDLLNLIKHFQIF